MRIPRLLEVLGRVGGKDGRRPAPSGTDRAAGGAGRAAPKEPYAPEQRAGAAKPQVYVEEVRVRTGRFDALEPRQPGFEGAHRMPDRDTAAGAGAPGPTRRKPARAERERISVSTDIEGAGPALRRPPAGRR